MITEIDDNQVYRSLQIKDPDDDELAAIRFILLAIQNLNDSEKSRVIKYIKDRLEI